MRGKVFISHSRRDEELVDRIARALEIVDYEVLVYEWEEKDENEPDKDAIKRNMRDCDVCFVFPTPAVHERAITRSWLVAEAAMAETLNIPTVVFKEEGDDYEIPFPYFDSLVLYDREELPLQIQEGIDELQQSTGNEAVGAVGGGLLGLAAVGTGGAALVGALIGAALTSGGEEEKKSLVPPATGCSPTGVHRASSSVHTATLQ